MIKRLFLPFLFTLQIPLVHALTAEEKARLEELRTFSIESLQEIEVKLDDVFDVFDGLVKRQTVKVASGIEQSTDTAPASVTVITAQDIEAMGARNLWEALEIVPGLNTSLNSSSLTEQPIIRGIYSFDNYEVLLMINGVPIKSAIDGRRGGLWTPPPLQMVSRIEVIRGPGSALYGADAVAGVVNIITKTPETIEKNEVGLRVGSFGTVNPWLLYGTQWEEVKMLFSLNYFQTDGHHGVLLDDLQVLSDRQWGTDLSVTPKEANLSAKNLYLSADVAWQDWRLRANIQQARDYEQAFGGAFVTNPEQKYEDDQIQIDLIYHNQSFTPNWELYTLLSHRRYDLSDAYNYSLRPNGIRDGVRYPFGAPNFITYAEAQTLLDIQATYRGWQAHTLRVGTGISYKDLHTITWFFMPQPLSGRLVEMTANGTVLIPENIRENRYAFIQDTWRFAPDWELTAGVRHDWYSDFDSTTNPRLALVWQIQPNLSAKVLYGNAFRAPSFVEMYAPRNRALEGNPNLKAEKNETWEIGVDYRPTDFLHISANLYQYQIQDKIQRNIISLPDRVIYRYDNVGELKGQGLEFETRWKINTKSSLLFNYAYVHAENENSEEAGNYPHHQAYLRYDWLLGNSWFFDARLNAILDRQRPQGDNRSALADYYELDLTLRYKDVGDKSPWNFALGVRNALDEDRREPSDPRLVGDYPKAGREWFGELRYSFD